MDRILSTINRYLPLLFLIVLGLAIARAVDHYLPHFVTQLTRTLQRLGTASQHGWPIPALLLSLCLLLVLSGLLAQSGRLPLWVQRRTWLMDILDRLTNRQQIESRLEGQADQSTVIDAEALAAALKSKIIGQDQICDDLAAQIRRRLALRQRGRPIGVFLFAGYPGTGKTYTAKRLAIELTRKLLYLDMTQFSRGMAASMLFGSPKGYVGSNTYGQLTGGLRDTPDALVLLDEIEKADPEVHKKFLTAWNDGFVTEASDGRQIPTHKAIFVLTTNAAIDELEGISAQYANDPDQMRRAATHALEQAGFAPEVLSRIDRVFVYKRLEGLDIARVTALEIEKMIHGYGLSITDQGIDPEILLRLMARQEKLADAASSRDLVRAIEEAVADSLIAAKQQGAKCIRLIEQQGSISAEPVNEN